MTKKVFLVLSIVFALFIYSVPSFATFNTIQNGMENAGNTVKNSMDKAGNSIQNTGNAITNGVSNMGNTQNDNQKNNNGIVGMTNNNGNYTATRTAGETTTFMGMNSTMWTWLIFGLLGIAVVSLVWYYGMQKNENHHES